jgi:flagellar protein FlbD
VLNAEQIETVEATPDTVIRLLNGKKVVVRETVQEVLELALDYARRIHHIEVVPVDPALLAAGAQTAANGVRIG